MSGNIDRIPCPYCAELVLPAAEVCHFCGGALGEAGQPRAGEAPQVTKKRSGYGGPIIGGLIFVIVIVIAMIAGSRNDKTNDVPVELDYSKPVFTQYSAMICPANLLFDARADHEPSAIIIDAFTSDLSKASKAKALGCEIWQDGLMVTASPMPGMEGFAWVQRLDSNSSLFTMERELTNKAPHQ